MPKSVFDAAALERLADLCRLHLSPEEAKTLFAQLQQVMGHVASIESVDLSAVAPMDHPTLDATPLRADRLTPGFSIEAVMRNAPERLGDGFGVPKILGEEA
jgi:aspartyl-tRNA(Asn)/glutamyl-tRNA(Gln) amidotransferase subunit C